MSEKPIPDVSVIIGAYEAMPYLIRCLESVEAQTIGADRIEMVAVDDGSTDGTGEYLEEFAARSAVATRVIRQANSGGPSGPRNVGLGLARGRYVFFLDADDYFGDEALERMVAMADRAHTDVVLGKVVGVNRGAPMSMWTATRSRVDIYNSKIIYTLSAQKLFRRELLERIGLRFDEELRTGEDALFTMEAYLRGAGVSVISDYTCYHLVGRDDGKHVTKSGTYLWRFDSMLAMMALVHRLEPAGPKRDILMIRPFTIGMLQQFGPVFLRDSEEIRRDKMELAAPLMDVYWNDGVARLIKVAERLRLAAVARGRSDVLVDVLTYLRQKSVPDVVRSGKGDRVFLAYPHFRDRSSGLSDSDFEVTVPDWHGGKRIESPVAAARRMSLSRRAVRRMRRAVRRWRARLSTG
ncbi:MULTISPECIES: glycosyltransferase family 2 protein [unclassified Streptomyces]|uniref:glycosyltransferase family 2 protein n=1 Tax=unclassified Streptomyces TaxID=2593676 RepID=UPI00224CB5F4|nr:MULTISPECIES: glycosyltransferase family A protein [unclassified Streptomyces]WSP55012.1 glycosyltransferase family 2 protein [Streptomyces sp. NBC_01241]WSU24247.1 glycosyltransferase family 2 protein [Streptomyces sp. NBC_01108]MCX4786685.1 glycosyltransferase family 2 protein [Streptomyces sp. NBC_01221]MCX4797542.1 glycosyltransferase family 2 protein [Streptomyces sp. NBC_01242]WSJ38844.1 glycosyltransferase family 2 protein [Streptomyces sp. NBC_01321]